MRDYISHSQISMMLRCGESYRRRYIENEKIPPGIALLKGSAVHTGIEFNNKQKITSFKDMKKADIVDCSVNSFEEREKMEGLHLTDDEKSIGKDKIVNKTKNSIVTVSGLYSDDMAPTIQPVEAEKRIEFEIDGTKIVSIIDCIDEDGNIRDAKVTGRKKNQKDIDKSLQLTMYYQAYEHEYHETPRGVTYDVLVDRKVPEYQLLESVRVQRDFVNLEHIVKSVKDGISKGVFLPASEGSWNCDPRWCGYYHSCKYKGE